MGAFLSVMGIIAFITTTFLTSRLIGRYGLRFGLLAMPLLVTLGVGLLAVGGSLSVSTMLIFGLGVSVKLINVALGFSLSQSSNVLVYQSLSDRIRPRIQTTAEGIVQAHCHRQCWIGPARFDSRVGFRLHRSVLCLSRSGCYLDYIYRLPGPRVCAGLDAHHHPPPPG